MNFKHISQMAMALLTIGTLFLAGCNTMEGVGKDIEAGGESIQDAAD